MKEIVCLAYIVLAFICADQVRAGNTRVIAGDPHSGPVYAYGWHMVAEQFHFTNIGGDTLYLNGLPFDPARPNRPQPVVPTERDISAHETSIKAGDAARNYANAADQLQAMASEYRRNPDVESVRIGDESLYIRFKGEEGETRVPLPRSETSQPVDRMKYHNELIDGFAYIVEHGGLYAWGDRYRVNAQPQFLSSVHEMIESACRGLNPSSTLVTKTGFYQKEFFDDLKLHKGQVFCRKPGKAHQGE